MIKWASCGNVGGASCPSAALEGLEAPPTLSSEISASRKLPGGAP
ncbi:MAG: hypothetical protein WC340_12555 [Kiritimatiellia bacterium]